MSNGLGAGFFGVTLLMILLGLAAVLTLVLVGVVGFRRRTGTVPQLLKYVSIASAASFWLLGLACWRCTMKQSFSLSYS
jgi:hypothetical protein